MRAAVASWRRTGLLALGVLALLAGGNGPVAAAQWLEPGDAALRSDVEILAAHGLIDGLTTTWPIPRGQLLRGLSSTERLQAQPEYVRQAAQHVLQALYESEPRSGLRPLAQVRLTNVPQDIRDFNAAARNDVDVAAGAGWDGSRASARLLVGDQARFNSDGTKLSFDGSEAVVRADNWLAYGGWVDQWDGPGWTSSLILSTNARPFAKVGVMRNDPHAFQTPWLSWLGPWQINSFIGLLDGPRIADDTLLGSLRLSFSPLHGLEVGLTRSTEFCGSHHPCNPLNTLQFDNSPNSQNKTNDEAGIDFKYSHALGALLVSPYVQFMNEDTGPFTHAYTSYLAGTSLAGAWGSDGARWRVTAEAADSVATLNWFDFGKKAYGQAYNNGGYPDGYRYLDRSLGFSLDSDSRLYSLAGQLTDTNGCTWRLTLYRALISTPQLAAFQAAAPSASRNVVSAEPVRYNQANAAVSVPWRAFLLDLGVSAQDRQPYPRGGGSFAAELGLRYGF